MTHVPDPQLWESFFALDTVGALRRFSLGLDGSTPEKSALAYYISTWSAFIDSNDEAVFVPVAHLSVDRSAVKYGNAPVIFEGSNLWAWKPYFTAEALTQKLHDLEHLIVQNRNSTPNAHMTLVLIPEKDHVISRFMRKETRFNSFDRAADELSGRLAARGIPMIFKQPFIEIDRFLTRGEFDYSDSHLPAQCYVTVFGFVLEALGISWASVRNRIGLQKMPNFGDLSIKFGDRQPTQELAFQPCISGAASSQTAGTASFVDPLGNTWQEFRNDQAPIDRSVCILGDSHSSIYAQRKLTYLFAETFRHTRFEWNPCSIRKKSDVAAYDYIILEISSRFVV